MILPIVTYGFPILKKRAEEIDQNYPNLDHFIENMFNTMYNAHGIGLAAPQVDKSIRIFITDSSSMVSNQLPEQQAKELRNFKKVFINPIIENEEGEDWSYEEGCLSIPNIREKIERKPKVVITYYDENWTKKTEVFDGIKGRIIQHEYDHLEGILFTDKISLIRKQIIRLKLQKITIGKVEESYPMRFYKKK